MPVQRTESRRQATTRLRLFFFLVLVTDLILSGCSGSALLLQRQDTGQQGHYIEQVPFYRQHDQQCGPAALAGVFAFWGRPLDQERIAETVYLPELRGALPMDLESFARSAGFDVAATSGTLDAVRVSISKGAPVICLLDLGFWVYHQPHYVTVIGYDDGRETIVMHDGRDPNRIVSYASFDKSWSRAGRWMIVITPKPAEH